MIYASFSKAGHDKIRIICTLIHLHEPSCVPQIPESERRTQEVDLTTIRTKIGPFFLASWGGPLRSRNLRTPGEAPK